MREDAIVLYGFMHDDERRCFEVLLGSHGVGPALALAIMAVLSPASLSTAVLEDDLDTLCTVPGVGRKTAARLLIELKSRLDLPDLSLDLHGCRPTARSALPGPRAPRPRAALSELGYAPEEIRGALDGLRDDVGVEEMLRLAPCASWPAGERARARREVLSTNGDATTKAAGADGGRRGAVWWRRSWPTAARRSKRPDSGPVR